MYADSDEVVGTNLPSIARLLNKKIVCNYGCEGGSQITFFLNM